MSIDKIGSVMHIEMMLSTCARSSLARHLCMGIELVRVELSNCNGHFITCTQVHDIL